MPSKMKKINDSTADLFSEEDSKTYRSAKKARRCGKKPAKQNHEDDADAAPLIQSLAPAAARNQRDSYAGRMISTLSMKTM